MNFLKRFLGIIWIALAILASYYCVFVLGFPKIISQKQEDLVFGVIILTILTPIIVGGLAVFGAYALWGEYDDEKM